MSRWIEGEPVKDGRINVDDPESALIISHHMATVVTAETPVIPLIPDIAPETVGALGNSDIFGPEQGCARYWCCWPVSAHRAVTNKLGNGGTDNLNFHFTAETASPEDVINGLIARRHVGAPGYMFIYHIRYC